MLEQTKYCPQCGAEYLARAQQCADCGCELRWNPPADGPRRVRATPTGGSDLEPGLEPPIGADEEVERLRTAEVDWIRELAEELARRGIPSRRIPATREDGSGAVQPVREGWSFAFHLYVRPVDLERAREIDGRLELARMPGLAENPYLEIEGDACPACGHPLPEDCAECPDCGLAFAVEEDADPPEEDPRP